MLKLQNHNSATYFRRKYNTIYSINQTKSNQTFGTTIGWDSFTTGTGLPLDPESIFKNKSNLDEDDEDEVDCDFDDLEVCSGLDSSYLDLGRSLIITCINRRKWVKKKGQKLVICYITNIMQFHLLTTMIIQLFFTH